MYTSAKDSLHVMRRMLDAQEDSDRYGLMSSSRGENGGSKTRSLSKDSKVSPRIHRLNDPSRIQASCDSNPYDLELEIDLPKKSHGLITSSKPKIKKPLNLNNSHDGSSGEIDPRTNQDLHKKPPVKPSSKISSSTLRDITRELQNEEKRRPEKQSFNNSINPSSNNPPVSSPRHNQAQPVFQKPANILCNTQQTMTSISPRISPYNKGNTSTKTHLLSKAVSSENDVTPAKDMYNRFLNRGQPEPTNENNLIEQERLDREYRVKEPVTFKDSNKKQSKTDSIRVNKSQNQSQTDRVVTPSSNTKTPTNPATTISTLDASLKRKLEFDEDKIESISNRVSEFLEKKAVKSASANINKQKFDLANVLNNTNHMPQPKPFFKSESPIPFASTQTAYLSTEASMGSRSGYNSAQRYDSNTVRTLNSTNHLSGRSQEDDRLVLDLNDKNKVMSYILDLKNKIQAKDIELLELRNGRSKNDIDFQNQALHIRELISENKRHEGNIEKLKHQIECQENEIEFLKKCKQRLETNLHDAGSIFEAKDHPKVRRLESALDEKNRELSALSEKYATSKTQFEEEKNKMLKDLEKLRLELNSKDSENTLLKAEVEALSNKMKEYKLIDNHIMELEDMQNTLIEENNTLKERINALAKNEENHSTRDMAAQLLNTSKKLKEIDEYSKKLIKILQSVIKGDEPPIELILKHNRSSKDREKFVSENDFRAMTIKQLSQQNVVIIDALYKNFIQCMDEICDSYALKYGNECNVQ